MANIKDWIRDKLGNILVPKTLTSAVYDDKNVALNDTLSEINNKLTNKVNKTDVSITWFIFNQQIENANANTLKTSGIYICTGTSTNTPTKEPYIIFVFGNGGSYLAQLAFKIGDTVPQLYFRKYVANNFTDWVNLYN